MEANHKNVVHNSNSFIHLAGDDNSEMLETEDVFQIESNFIVGEEISKRESSFDLAN